MVTSATMDVALTSHILDAIALARLSLCGKGLELLGGCYLAYDLLDGRNGPLRGIARATGYLPLFMAGYALLLGIPFALAASAGMATLLAIEFQWMAAAPSRNGGVSRVEILGFLRGLELGAASMTLAGPAYGAMLGVLGGAALLAGYRFGLAPSDDYETKRTPGLRPHNLLASAYRAVAIAAAAAVTGVWRHRPDALGLALRLGLAAGLVSALVGVFSPLIERWIVKAPSRRLGLVGLGLLLLGTMVDAAPEIVTAFGRNA